MGRKKKYLTEEERKAAHRERQRKRYQANPEKERERQRKRYQENPEKRKEINRKWRKNNPDKVNESNRKRYQENSEKEKERKRKWREKNPDKVKEIARKYQSTPIGRANLLVNNYKRHDKNAKRGECTITDQWIVDNIFTQPCFYCDESDWHKLGCDRIDNSLPHTPENVVCCCEECNKKRGTKDFVEFLKEIGRLDKLKELKDKIIIADNVFVD